MARAPGSEGDLHHQGKEGLTGGQGTLVGKMGELLAALRRQGTSGCLPLLHPFALGRAVRGHARPPWAGRSLMDLMIYERGPFIHPSVTGKGDAHGAAAQGEIRVLNEARSRFVDLSVRRNRGAVEEVHGQDQQRRLRRCARPADQEHGSPPRALICPRYATPPSPSSKGEGISQ